MSAISIRKLASWSLLAGMSVAAVPAPAASVAWTGNRFVYATNGSSIAETLSVFAAGQHLPVRIEGDVQGVVSGRFAMPPERFLDMLARSYGFVWYYDGAVLQVSPASALTHIAIRPNFLPMGALHEALEQAGVTDEHFPLTVDDATRTVDVRGPASYVARIRASAQTFEDDARRRVRTTVRVFRLNVANAADENRVIDGRTVTVPGAATLLRRRFERAVPSKADHPAADVPQVVEFDAPLPTIEADAATNSILIRDKPDRIDADGVLVADLDVQPERVSVKTWVAEVDPELAIDASRYARSHMKFPDAMPSNISSGDCRMLFCQ